jgi:hypothetical protein
MSNRTRAGEPKKKIEVWLADFVHLRSEVFEFCDGRITQSHLLDLVRMLDAKYGAVVPPSHENDD